MPARWVTLRALGIVVFLATAALPMYRCNGPQRRVRSEWPGATLVDVGAGVGRPALVPAREIARDFGDGLERAGPLEGLWSARRWYPFLLAPLWLAGLALAGVASPRGRRVLGLSFLGLTAAVAVLEAFYIAVDYRGLLAGTSAAPVEAAAAWSLVLVVLLARPGGFRVADVEGTIAAQTLLGLFHAFTFPAYDAIRWLSWGHDLAAVAGGILSSYRPAFWLAVAALAASAVPAYVPRARRARASAVAPAAASAGG